MTSPQSSFSLGKLFGVDVRAHPTLPWVLGLGALALMVFGGPAAVLGGLFVVLGLILSVTLHELGHIGAASLFGNRTRGITLTPIGGVATLERESQSPKEEVVVALAGPAVSLILAGLAGIPLVFFGPSLVAEWFLRLNLILALFNLLPAYPTDGGRVLRGFLWKKRGYLEASRVAARTGQFFGLAFVLGALFAGPILFVVGLYVIWHATRELTRLHLLRYAHTLEEQGLDPRSIASLLFGHEQSVQPPPPPRHTASSPRDTWRAKANSGGGFSKIEFEIGPDGRARPVDRSPW
jgi:Zn-dependent protease